jgi:phospholipid-translocating ATPase
MLNEKWRIPWRKHGTQDDEDGPNRRDENYEEVRRRSSIKSANSHTLARTHSIVSLHRTQTTVKLRKIVSGGRRVFVNLPLPVYDLQKNGKAVNTYVSNRIRTSKYTIFSFIPKNLFEQFRRPANMYFLGMAILQMLPFFGVNSPALTLLPLCTVVVITAAKDAVEDFQRHKVDQQYNKNITHTLHGYKNTNFPEGTTQSAGLLSWFKSKKANVTNQQEDEKQPNAIQEENTPVEFHSSENPSSDVFVKSVSKDIRVGDFILLRNGDSLPADVVLLSTSDKHGICFVETKDLDGETNLKPRNSVQELKHIQSGEDCLNDCHFYIEAGAPAPDLYKFEGTLVTLEKHENADKWVEKSKTPIEIENILLRGHIVRNTKWAIAVVLFTGTDTKIMLNSGETPSKRSQVDKQMNQEVHKYEFLIDF